MGVHNKIPGQGVDFHMHTLASDGLWSAEKLVETAVAQGIKVMTVTDHDTLGSVNKVQTLAEEHGIRFVPGVEITVNWKGLTNHLLLLNFNPTDANLNMLLKDTQNRENAKKQSILEGLRKRGFTLHALEHYKRPDGHFLVMDIVRALVRGHELPTFERALNTCLEIGLDERISQPADLAFRIGLAAGGIPVLAHPCRTDAGISEAPKWALEEYVEMGLGGVEAYHYSHSTEMIERMVRFARNNDIAVSCGSDSHNESRKPMPWNPELCRSLLERLDLEVPSAAA